MSTVLPPNVQTHAKCFNFLFPDSVARQRFQYSQDRASAVETERNQILTALSAGEKFNSLLVTCPLSIGIWIEKRNLQRLDQNAQVQPK
jgi:hypothetical protein